MAASKRRQDEKNLKLLRELGSFPHNKQCFDCHQRGPTYLNMTIGSFVCTACSGILRGLNPPHRVKSISMASFTPDEIEFIKSRGNEFCQREWMGTYDNHPPIETETKDEQRIKDFMSMKYERKRWYVDPSTFRHLPMSSQSLSSAASVPETKPLSSLLGNNIKNLHVQNAQVPITRPVMQSASFPPASVSSSAKPTMDLLSDLGSADPFASSSANKTAANSANPSFANFDNFVPAFPPWPPSANTTSATGTSAPPLPMPTAQQPPPKDKYAALADLDNLFHSNNVTTISNNSSVDWDGKCASGTSTWAVNGTTPALFGGNLSNASASFTSAPSNPFTGSSSSVSVWNNQTPTSAPTPSPGNPFMTGLVTPSNHVSNARAISPAAADSHASFGMPQGYTAAVNNYSSISGGWPTINQQASSVYTSPTNGNYPSYKMAVNPQFGTWQQTAAVGNPFAVGSTSATQRPASSNPFL